MSVDNDATFDEVLMAQINEIGGCPVCTRRIPNERLNSVRCGKRKEFPDCIGKDQGFELDEEI